MEIGHEIISTIIFLPFLSASVTDARLTGDQEIAGSITRWVRQHSFVEIDQEIFSTVILPYADSRKSFVSFWRKNVHKYWLTA